MNRVIYLQPKDHTCPYCHTHFITENGREVCPNCKAEVVGISRITGYLSMDERWNTAKTNEREDRVSHNDK